jgi:periplasmic divalent cation tolerance protein
VPDAATAAARIGWTTLPTREDAERLAVMLVERRLAACVQIDGPVESHYHWQGKPCRDTEWRLAVKHLAANATAVEAAVLQNHPYTVPQWIAVDATGVSPAYLAWMLDNNLPNARP